jgi:hypothetical protein
MAAPHVGGGGALVLAGGNDSAAAVEAALRTASINTGTSSKDGYAIRRLNVLGY